MVLVQVVPSTPFLVGAKCVERNMREVGLAAVYLLPMRMRLA